MPAGPTALAPRHERVETLLRGLDRPAIAILLALVGLYAATSLRCPFNWDHGIFAWIAETIVR